MNSVKEKFLEYVMHGDTENASNYYRKHKKPKFFAKESKVYIDKDDKNVIGPIAIEGAIDRNHWDMVDWLLCR